MNLEQLQNKNILLFGKSRAFSTDEFASQMKFHKIGVVSEYSDDVALVVDGKMMTPYEQNASNALYEAKSTILEFISIEALEREVAKYIDPETLLMSLKLSRDKERLKSFIQNSTIKDELFFKLLKMYSWGGEDFFENDDNRDVSAAIILRFYENIERNHNVQYATTGFMHLISQSNSAEIIEMIFELEPLQKSLHVEANALNLNILSAIATHPKTPKSILNKLIKKANPRVKMLIAKRQDCDEEMQIELYNSKNEEVLEALCKSRNLSTELIPKFINDEKYIKYLAQNLRLDSEIFEELIKKTPLEVAKNSSLTLYMQQCLADLNLDDVNISLANNNNLDNNVAMRLLEFNSKILTSEIYKNSTLSQATLIEAYKDEANHASLAQNSNTPCEILEALLNSEDIEVLKALAQNPNTPVEVLYQLQLDSRVARQVKENAAFTKHIQQENIGWEV
ncbi:hypothetical protein Suden_1783 [Sulfurimonas denitrificans DSM 1251]|uniref:Leucine rich repeat variant n=1 Tax=Sulfurimonas denitrificans (strain ATCC 33889 / DSM 1251) TaxID=326298 RepID=Q30PM4_SULDN|nr:hypothetical protein [Sulfurimonas denitrificans]ABB45057.1 hypothetical protein Suden_1783 [Sulfurimonas denitrificans DSM 1251]MDD3442184.1 hypothetical protein [Sulfurimonas denitrificans]